MLDERAFWRDFWQQFGHDSTDIAGTGFLPDDKIERAEYPIDYWLPDDGRRNHLDHRRSND